MARILPFTAWRYDPKCVQVGQVVTQPYDKITVGEQERYYQANPYNLVRIILGKRQGSDSSSDNVYTRAAGYFANWRESGVLRQDAEAGFYRYTQTFSIPGGSGVAERLGFIAIGELKEYSAGVVFRHEQTLAKPKADRLELLRSTRAHFGQIFMLYSGAGTIDTLLQTAAVPDIDVTDEYGVVHRTWKISDLDLIRSVQSAMEDKKLIIADGHHRYETALAYRDERRRNAPAAQAPWDWAMMTFVDMDSPGLVILPTHRVISGLASLSVESFRERALEFFKIEEADPEIDAARAAETLRRAGQAGIAMLAVTAEQALLIHSPKASGTDLFSGFSDKQRSLDVLQLHRCLLERVLGISQEAIRDEHGISYYREIGDALRQVRSKQAQIAFLMNPARIQQVRDIALAGDVLPQKSTDFYPKLLSGLTIYALD